MPQINANKQSLATAAATAATAAKIVHDYLSRRVASSDGLPRLRSTSTFSEAARFDVIAAAVNAHAALKQLPCLYKRALEIVGDEAFEVPAELGDANAAEVRSWLVLAAEVLIEHAISGQGLVVLASLLTSDVDRTQLESAMSSILQSNYLQLFMNPSQYPMPVGCNTAIWRVGVIDVALKLGGFRTMQPPNIDISQLISDTGKSKWAILFDVVGKACGSATKDECSKAACALWAYALNSSIKRSKTNTKRSFRRSTKRSTINTKRSIKRNAKRNKIGIKRSAKRSKMDTKHSAKHNKDDTRSDINSNIIDNTAGPGSTGIDISSAAQLLISLLQRVPKTTPPLKRLVDKALHAFSEAIARCVVKFKGLSLLYDLERISQEILEGAVDAAEYFGRVLSEPDYISKYASDLPMIEIMDRYGTELEEILKEYLHMLHPGLNSDTRYALEGKLLTGIGTAQESHALSESDLEDGSLNESKFESWVASELFGECLGKFSKLPGQPLIVEATLDRNRLSAAFVRAALKLGSYVRQLLCLLDNASGIDIAELGSQRMYIALVHSLTVEYMEACPLALNVHGTSYGTVLLRDYDPLTLDLRFDSDALADATDFISDDDTGTDRRHRCRATSNVSNTDSDITAVESLSNAASPSSLSVTVGSPSSLPVIVESPSPSLAESISHMSLVKPAVSPLVNQRATRAPAASPAC
ncbi:hypothetical protein GQ42DRAFT_171269 [Ramicandelaber brevisporus]|nr:hypothetical protein GQ42DRAFT_171269 [Ramicandelaber brevisporus]